jgi:hypothetical protein
LRERQKACSGTMRRESINKVFNQTDLWKRRFQLRASVKAQVLLQQQITAVKVSTTWSAPSTIVRFALMKSGSWDHPKSRALFLSERGSRCFRLRTAIGETRSPQMMPMLSEGPVQGTRWR